MKVNMLNKIPQTPEEDAIQRLSIPLGCGYKNCDTVFGIQPLVYPYEPVYKLREWEAMLSDHFRLAHRGGRRLKEIKQ
jgi:hypothetical protein